MSARRLQQIGLTKNTNAIEIEGVNNLLELTHKFCA